MRNGPYILQVAPNEYPGKKYRGRYAYEHHLVWWRHRGGVPGPDEVIHHLNGNKHDNRIENLEKLGRGAHAKHHGGDRHVEESVVCGHCGKGFSAIPSKLKTRRKQNAGKLFCSLSCGALAQHKRAREEKPLTHGTSAGYMVRKCRCDVCREWNNARMRAHKAKKREIGGP